MVWSRNSSTSRLRAAALQVAPFVVAGIAAPLVSLSGGAEGQVLALLPGLALMAISLTGLIYATATQSGRLAANAWVWTWTVALGTLVHAVGGADSGATLILFLPALWLSLYGERLDALIALALMLTSVIAVTILDGASELTTTDTRRIVVFVTVPALAVWTISTLVQRLANSEADARQAEATLTIVAKASQRVRRDKDPRDMACRAVLELSKASLVRIFEPQSSTQLCETASTELQSGNLRIPLGQPSHRRDAYLGGRPVFTAVNSEAGSGRSVLLHPFGNDGTVQGVLEIVWDEQHAEPPEHTSAAISLLAQEIGWSIERADLMSALRQGATTDSLTGLANRRAWRDQITAMMEGPLCIAMLDLDHFKVYNDTFGHQAGDRLLRSLGTSWRRLVRPEDLLVRWGGEEFAIALPGCTIEQARPVLERLRGGVPMKQTVSIGLAERQGSEGIDIVVGRADAALYEAKRAGRNQICCAEVQLSRAAATSAP